MSSLTGVHDQEVVPICPLLSDPSQQESSHGVLKQIKTNGGKRERYTQHLTTNTLLLRWISTEIIACSRYCCRHSQTPDQIENHRF